MPDPSEIAARRFELIAILIDPSVDAARRRVAVRELLAKPVEWPGSLEQRRRGEPPILRRITKSTLYRWARLFREHGYEGLIPKSRKDRGKSRSSSPSTWVTYAIGLLYEQPSRSLWQLGLYLRVEFQAYSMSRSTLHRHLRAHPAYGGIVKLRKGRKSKLRDRWEAAYPHEGWQLDGKGPFRVRFVDGTTIELRVLSVIECYSRAILAAVIAVEEDTSATITVLEIAIGLWGLPDRIQYDRGGAFDSHAVRQGIAQLGVHRGYSKPGTPEYQGLVEAYHKALGAWFITELRAQEVVDSEHLQELLEAMLALVYNAHPHRVTKASPAQRLANRQSSRRVTQQDLERSFFIATTAKPDAKTGEVKLPSGSFRVPAAFAEQRSRFLYHPGRSGRAVLIAKDDREIELQPFIKRSLSELREREMKRGTGQLQKLVDLWRGSERPNAQPGFGLPEVFRELSQIVGRELPRSEKEAHVVLAFYRKHGPLPKEPFVAACKRTAAQLGEARPLTTYLDDIERQIVGEASPDESEDQA